MGQVHANSIVPLLMIPSLTHARGIRRLFNADLEWSRDSSIDRVSWLPI